MLAITTDGEMIRYVIAVALVLPITAHAEVTAEQQREHQCGIEGLVFQMAATWRDSNFTPQYAYDYLRKAKYGVDDAFIKRAVNLVYFDDKFAGVPGSVMNQTITQSCINPPKQWQPVQ
jgi:hypothetical protein